MKVCKVCKIGLIIIIMPIVLLCQASAQSEILSGIGDLTNNGFEVRALLISRVKTILSGELSARISEFRVDMGDCFKAGSKLVVFDCKIYAAQLTKATAEFNAATKFLEGYRKLDALGSISEIEMVSAIARMEIARAECVLQKAHVRKCVMTAPFNGRVVKRIATPFEYVSPGQPILEIIDGGLTLQIFVPSVWLRWLKPEQQFSIKIDETGQEYPARVTVLGARVDPVSQTLEIRADIQGSHPELLVGMSGSCVFQVPDSPVN